MKINIFRHKSKDGYLLLAVEWHEDVAPDLQHLLKLNAKIQDANIESPNVVSFKIVSTDDAGEKYIKTDIVNIVRSYLDTRDMLDTTGMPVEGDPHDPELILVPKNQFQHMITESADMRIHNAVLCEERRGTIEHLKLIRYGFYILLGGLCLFGGIILALTLILLRIV